MCENIISVFDIIQLLLVTYTVHNCKCCGYYTVQVRKDNAMQTYPFLAFNGIN